MLKFCFTSLLLTVVLVKDTISHDPPTSMALKPSKRWRDKHETLATNLLQFWKEYILQTGS